ncbi:MAG: hypothetical protein O2901_14730 [Verrucomicrobia bacterium]|nr:hypothetical protein [Verrucomicrobiota bacterium]
MDFIEELFRARNPKLIHRQKELEEQIEKPFSLETPPKRQS